LLDLCKNLVLDLTEMGKKGKAVLETRVSEKIYIYNPHRPSVMVLYLRYLGQLNSRE